ncbi:DUF421 domain-containing protein [Hymenobacter negativus]|uniref:DUF421 domain-containing protein n=1 Tax=Hymenobacter negativus TaxID=2795026 RepID=A0ABS3QJ80_9BACT|nr:YetF domain-containing protein [Hymenobacter negativus]MBO2011297.1 DUF421 domain-containing protein [Hymenobacter negativus]
MKPEDIHLSDWMRILVGEVPGSFYIEAVFRIVFIYLLLVVSMRLMGNRMGSPLTRNEMIAMVSLAAANGVALMAADRGLLPVVVIAIIVVAYQRFIAWRAFRSKRFESALLDDMAILVEDGRLNLDKLEEVVLARNQLFAQLRKESVGNLGQVRRAYQEANGNFSILTFDDEQLRPGLSILPAVDEAFRNEQQKADGQFACASCGHLQASAHPPAADCSRCEAREWQPAVLGA